MVMAAVSVPVVAAASSSSAWRLGWGRGRRYLGAHDVVAVVLATAWNHDHVLAPVGEGHGSEVGRVVPSAAVDEVDSALLRVRSDHVIAGPGQDVVVARAA